MALLVVRSGFQSTKTTLCSISRRLATATNLSGAEEYVSWENALPYEEIPGPKPLPILGIFHQFIPGIGEMGDPDMLIQHQKLREKYGNIVKFSKIPGRRDIVFLFDPKYFEEVYRKEGPWPDRDILQALVYYRKHFRKDFFQGKGGLMVDAGEEWKQFRTKVNPPMMQPRVAHTYIKPISEVSNDFLKRTKSLRDSKGELPDDYINEVYRWALETIAMIALDTRLGCLDPNIKAESEPQRMIDALEDFFQCSEIMEMRPPLWKVMSTPTWRRFIKALDFFTDVSMKHINNGIKKMKEAKPGERDYSVMERILLRDPDPRTACLMALDMLLAGVDTTSFSLTSLLYHLSNCQSKQQYLFDELVQFLPNKDAEITSDMLEEMKYLKACIKESMRLSAIAPTNTRGTSQGMVIGNYRVPKNVNILMAHLFVGRLEEHFPSASQFIPERWLKSRPSGDSSSVGSPEDYDKTKEPKANPFVFLPFGFGPRMCIGKRFAELELEVMTVKMIRNFRFEYNYEMKFSSNFFHKPASPLKFKLIDREV